MAMRNLIFPVRTISTSIKSLRPNAATQTNPNKPPIKVYGKTGIYANALYTAAAKVNKLDSVEKDLTALNSLLTKDSEFKDFIRNPITGKAEKLEKIKKVGSQHSFEPITTNFLDVLVHNSRLKDVAQYISAFKLIMGAVRGEVRCTVTTAKDLDAANQKELEATLQLFIKPGQQIILDTKVDESLIGGMIVQIGDNFIDMSTSSKIRKITEIISVPLEG